MAGSSTAGRLLLAILPVLAPGAPPESVIEYRNLKPGVRFTGTKSCIGCHQQIYLSFRRTAMGASADLASAKTELARVPRPVTVFSEKFNKYFDVFRKDGDLYQSMYEKDADGNEIYRVTHKLDYVIGAGKVGYTYVVRRDNYLFEAPLSYYRETNKWDLSPGYELADHGFARPIVEGCAICHTGTPQASPDWIGMYQDPPFHDLSVGCEDCHGPGQLHVEERVKKINPKVDTSVVNPARLPGHLADDICMFCHQGGDTRVLQPGKRYTDYLAGMPLSDVVAVFKVPMRLEQRADADRMETMPPVRGGLAQPSWWKNTAMKLSKCYDASGGKLRCMTCHNGHYVPASAAAAPYYRRKCLGCHSESSRRAALAQGASRGVSRKAPGCALPLSKRLPANDCAGCHMPKRVIAGIAHSDSTNHRIVRRPGQPLPDAAFGGTTPDLPDLIYVNRPAGEAPSTLSLETQLTAYGELLDKRPDFQSSYFRVLDELIRKEPDHPVALAAMGRKSLLEKNPARAAEYLSRAIKLGYRPPTTYRDLGEALALGGRLDESAEVLERAVELYPYAPVLSKSLAHSYILLKRYPRAYHVMKRHIDTFPEDTFMRGLLKKLESGGVPR
jgi:hypothetical protein